MTLGGVQVGGGGGVDPGVGDGGQAGAATYPSGQPVGVGVQTAGGVVTVGSAGGGGVVGSTATGSATTVIVQSIVANSVVAPKRPVTVTVAV